MTNTCPACGNGVAERFLHLPTVPILSTAYHSDELAARTAPVGDLDLALCRQCSFVWNLAFDADRVGYTTDYENSQHFSPSFDAFAHDLARHLARAHGLQGRTVVEVGCGKAEFLAILCDEAGCRGLGFDPTFDGEVDHARIEVRRELFDPASGADVDAALVMARHVLEHVDDPGSFLADIAATVDPATPVYLEMPNASHVFSDRGMWDLIYQHVGYWSAPALRALLARLGWAVNRMATPFDDQFLAVEARPGPRGAPPPDPADVAAACALADTFAARFQRRLQDWRDRLAAPRDAKVALWGAGAKGVAFLNALGPGPGVDLVVDVNPRKHGRHVPGTGHRISAPAELGGNRDVATVLVMNPTYQAEIEASMAELACPAEVATV